MSNNGLPFLLKQLGQLARMALKEVVLEALAEAQPAKPTLPGLLTPDELCEAIRVSRSKLDSLLKEGLPYVKCGSTKRYDLDQVKAWMRSQGNEEAA